MREAYRLFNGEGSEEELRAVAANGPADEFYSLLYVGLWREARGEPEAAKEAMVAAVQSLYGRAHSLFTHQKLRASTRLFHLSPTDS